MADANISAGSNRITLDQRIASAIEMAMEIKAEGSRQYSLASVLTDRLESGTTAHGIGEVLEERLADEAQTCRLIQCLEEIQKELCHG